jgi:hypothetical protein
MSRLPLHYTVAAAGPLHVRSGSALVRFGERLAVIQDDAGVVAFVDLASGAVEAVPLPGAPSGADKSTKLDLEAAVVVGGSLIAFGSGSTPARERIVVIDRDRRARIIDAPVLYAALRATREFSGAELNIEGAWSDGERLRLFNRGNGRLCDGVSPVDATCDLDLRALLGYLDGHCAPPPPREITQYDLGRVAGVRLTFTDAAGAYYLAAAEDCPDAVQDGPVCGVALGIIPPTGEPRYTLIRERDETLFTLKAEGLCLDDNDASRAWTVVDLDNPDQASLLCELSLTGPWS